MSEGKTYCPNCKSDNVVTTQQKQPDGETVGSIIKGYIPTMDISKEKRLNGIQMTYKGFFCMACHVFFAVGDLDVTFEGIIKNEEVNK